MTEKSLQTSLGPEALARLRPHHLTIVSLVREHKPVAEVARQVGSTPDEITAYITNVHSFSAMKLSREDLNAVELARLTLKHDEIAQRLKDNQTYGEIAEVLGTTASMLSRYVLRSDLPARSPGFPRGRSRASNDPVRLERRQRAAELRSQGMTLEEIATAMGYTSKERARQLLKEAGVAGTREEIAKDRILIVEAIVPHLAEGLSIEKISEKLAGQDIKTLDIVDTMNAAKKGYYERLEKTAKDPWPILPQVLAAMAKLREALAKREGLKQDRTQAQARRSELVANALRPFTAHQRTALAATTRLHKATINTLASGSRIPTPHEWSVLAPHLPDIATVPMPE